MPELMKQISRVRFRLAAKLFVERLAIAWCLAFAVAFAVLLAGKFWHLSVNSREWQIGWLVGAGIVGLLAAVVLMLIKRPTSLEAAKELDRRMKLRERISSALQLSPSERQSAVGQAIVSDATKASARVDVRDAFAIRVSPRRAWTLLPILMAVATWFIPDAEPKKATANVVNEATVTQVKNQARSLLQQVKKQRENAEDEKLEEATEFLKQLEKKLESFEKSQIKEPKKLLADINQLKDALDQRRQQLGSSDELKKRLADLKSLDKGPAEKASQAIQNSDFDKAVDELEKLADKLNSGEMSPEDQAALSKQLSEMAKQLEDAVAKHEQEVQELKDKLEAAEAAGDPQQVAELRKELAEKMAASDKMAEMAKIAKQMEKAGEACKNGQCDRAAESLGEIKKQLAELAKEGKQLEALDELMEGAEACKRCAQGNQTKNGKEGGKDEENGAGQGSGIGNSRGPLGNEPLDQDGNFFDSQVRGDAKKGETIYAGPVGGENRKGTTREEVQQAILSAKADDPEALESLPLTRKQRAQAREYYESLRDGK
jgi:exonuclease VII small subunit